MIGTFEHKTVLLNEAVDSLNVQPDGVYIDATFGRGGHSQLILSKLGEDGQLLVIDRDPEAILVAKALADQDPRLTVSYGSFSKLVSYATQRRLDGRIHGILFDLGISSPQLDNASRGFSFLNDGPLDMRMDFSVGLSAAAWIKQASVEDITWVLKTFGEERFARQIAISIASCRAKQSLTRTTELARLINDAVPVKEKHKHPATRSFQAIRIYINNELEEIRQALQGTLRLLMPGGRLSVISFHSLEDRLVKHFIRSQQGDQNIPRGLPITTAQISERYKMKSVGKFLKPSAEEVSRNNRARSAVMRVAEKL